MDAAEHDRDPALAVNMEPEPPPQKAAVTLVQNEFDEADPEVEHFLEDSDNAVIRYFRQIDDYDREEVLLSPTSTTVGLKLPERVWSIRHTLSYWVCINFMCGSLLFVTAGVADMYELDENNVRAVIDYPYVIGAFNYFWGCYAGLVHVINEKVPKDQPIVWFTCQRKFRTYGWWAMFSWSLGALFFQFGTILPLITTWTSPDKSKVLWTAYTIGSTCFVIGSGCEMIENKFWVWRPYKIGWWIAYLNEVGSLFWLEGSIAGFYVPSSMGAVKVPYVVGAACFLLTGTCGLIMWKLDQFGLQFLPRMNTAQVATKVTWVQLPFIVVYCILFCAEVPGIVWARECAHSHVRQHIWGMLVAVMLMLLGSVLHRVPARAPWHYLVMGMRVMYTSYLVLSLLDSRDTWRGDC